VIAVKHLFRIAAKPQKGLMMESMNSLTRRQFVAGASSLLLAGAALEGKAAETPATAAPGAKLAIDGGEKTIKTPPVHKGRWGEPELKQLNEMLNEGSLFFWNTSGRGGLNPKTQLLTDRFQKIYPLKYVQTCSSGTAAVHIATAACGVGPGDEVIVPPLTDPGSLIGTIYQQGVPVFADISLATYNLDPADVERKITPKTKAIVAVHLNGNPCDMAALKALADKHKLALIEDACQGWGAKYRGQPVGLVGHFLCYSLQISKIISCGDGGVVASNDERYGPLLLNFADKGGDRRGRSGGGSGRRLFSTNYRMSGPQIAVTAAQLERLEWIASTRSRLGNLLSEKLAGVPGITPLQVHPEDRCVYWFHHFRINPKAFKCSRNEFANALAAEGVQCSPPFGGLLYQGPVFQEHGFFAGRWPIKEFGLTTMDYTKVRCPQAEEVFATDVTLTFHEGMTEEHVLLMAKAIEKVARHYAV
jgi:dTDP-4-amino-4,6-dideoxygalactose transaminase